MANDATTLQWAQSVYERYRQQMANLTGIADPGVTFVIDHDLKYPAETQGTIIHINPDLMPSSHVPGMIVHEMAHAFIQDPNYSASGGHEAGRTGDQEGYDEAFADYLRWKLTGGGTEGEPGWTLSAHGHRFALMDVEQIRDGAQAMKAGTFTNPMMQNPETIPGVGTGVGGGTAPAATPAPGAPPGGGGTTAGTGGAINDPVYQAYIDVMKTFTPRDPQGWWDGLDRKDKQAVTAAINQATTGANFGIHSPLEQIGAAIDATDAAIGYTLPKGNGGGGDGNGNDPFGATVTTTAQGGTTGIAKPGDYISDLDAMGLPMNNELRDLINRTQDKNDPLYNMTTKEFEHQVRLTDTYAKFYPGIIGPNGEQLMSESAYNSLARDYKGIAGANGLAIGRNEVGHLISQNISVDEFRTRAQAIQRIEQYRPAFQQFNATLKAMGMQPLDEAGIQKFVLGEASPEFYKIWNEAATRTAAVSAGIKLGPKAETGQLGDVSLNRKEIRQIEHATGGQFSAQQAQDLAQKLQTLLPQSRIQKMGLDREDIIQLETGGPRQARAFDIASQIVANQQAREKGQGQGYQQHQTLGSRQAGQNEGY